MIQGHFSRQSEYLEAIKKRSNHFHTFFNLIMSGHDLNSEEVTSVNTLIGRLTCQIEEYELKLGGENKLGFYMKLRNKLQSLIDGSINLQDYYEEVDNKVDSLMRGKIFGDES